MSKVFSARNDGLKIFDSGTGDVIIGDKNLFTAAQVGNGNYLFDPKTGRTWSSDGSSFTETTPGNLPADPNVEGAILRWNDTSNQWVAETDITVSSAGSVTTSGTITVTNTTASTNKDTGAIVTEGGIGVEGNVNAGGNIAAGGDISSTGNASVGGNLTVTGSATASSADINGAATISGTVTLDNAAANTLAMSGTTNTVDLNGTGAQLIEMAGTTNTIDMTGSGAHEIQMGGTTNTIDLNGTGAQSIEMAGTTNTITLGGSGNATIAFTAGGTKKITGLDNPTAATDAANKAYVDAVASGLSVKSPARVATTAALHGSPTYDNGTGGVGATLTSSINVSINSPGIDGVTTLAVGDEILVKNESNAAHNGKYSVTVVGSATTQYVLTRVPPYDQASEITDGSFFFILEGSTNANKGFVQTETVTTIGTDNILFEQFSSAGSGVSSINTESGTATPSGGSITITGSPSIDTSGSGSTVTIALAADLTTGATGFTIADTRIPFATAANTLGTNAALSFDDGSTHILSLGTTTSTGIVMGHSTSGFGVISSQGTSQPFNGSPLATDTNSGHMVFMSGEVSGTGKSGSTQISTGPAVNDDSGFVSVWSGNTTGSGDSGPASLYSGNCSGSGKSGDVVVKSGYVTSGTYSGVVSVGSGNGPNSGVVSVGSGNGSGSGNSSGNVNVGSGPGHAGANSGNLSLKTGNSTTANSGNIAIETGTAGGTRGTITITADADDTILTNTPTDANTSADKKAVINVDYVRKDVIQRSVNSSVSNGSTLDFTVNADAVKFYVKVKGNTTESDAYASEIMAIVDSGSTVSATEYAVVGNPSLASIAVSRISATSIQCSVTNNTGETATIAIHAVPIR